MTATARDATLAPAILARHLAELPDARAHEQGPAGGHAADARPRGAGFLRLLQQAAVQATDPVTTVTAARVAPRRASPQPEAVPT